MYIYIYIYIYIYYIYICNINNTIFHLNKVAAFNLEFVVSLNLLLGLHVFLRGFSKFCSLPFEYFQ